MRLRIFLFLFSIMLPQLTLRAATDSAKHKQRTLVVTPRFNTLNMAPVSGNIVNQHVNVDLTFVYAKNRFMWVIANGIDLEDGGSEMNYFLTNVRYKINLSKHFGISPFLAFYSEHAHQLIDPISDVNAGPILTYQQGFVTVEAFVLFVRLMHPTLEKDVIFRFEIKCVFKYIVISGFVYQNASYFDNKDRLAVGFRAVLPEFKIFNKLTARSEVTGSFKIQENPITRNFSGVFLSLAFPLKM